MAGLSDQRRLVVQSQRVKWRAASTFTTTASTIAATMPGELERLASAEASAGAHPHLHASTARVATKSGRATSVP